MSQTPLHHAAAKGKRPRSWRYWTAARTRTPATSTDAPLCTARRSPTAAATSDPKRHSMSSRSRHSRAITVPSPPFVDVISQLVTRGGANVNARDDKGFTPLHAAAARGHYRCAVALIRAGADVQATCLRRRKPVDYAYGLDAPHLVSLLTDPSGHLAGSNPAPNPAVEGSKPRGGAYAKPAAPAPPYDAPFDFPSSLKDFPIPSTRMEETLIITLDWCARAGEGGTRARARGGGARNLGGAAERPPPPSRVRRLLIMVPIIGATVSRTNPRAAAGTCTKTPPWAT